MGRFFAYRKTGVQNDAKLLPKAPKMEPQINLGGGKPRTEKSQRPRRMEQMVWERVGVHDRQKER